MSEQTEPQRIERILTIIIRFLQLTITEQEHEELDSWLMESNYNISLFETLTHPENANGLRLMVDASGLEHFTITFNYDNEDIEALIIVSENNRYQVWMNRELKFTLACGLNDLDQQGWYLVDKHKYVPYVSEIGQKIANHLK
ncbi:MAG: hypothetical protein ABI687_02460 [Flavitalea sp.]